MATPDERTQNLLQAGAFLKELREDETVSEEIRREAYRLLRHYPTVYEVMMLAEPERRTTGIFYLTPDIEKGWTALAHTPGETRNAGASTSATAACRRARRSFAAHARFVAGRKHAPSERESP
jgi:hypothetical protein